MKRDASEAFDLAGALRECLQCTRSGAAARDSCVRCLRNQKKKVEEEKDDLEWRIKELQANRGFLRYHFGGAPAPKKEVEIEVPKGDVEIVVQGRNDQPLLAHKFVLASKSLVLRKMLETDMLEKETGVFRIDDATLPVVQAVVKFCYDAEIEFTEEVTSAAVLEVAHKYEIDHLVELCVDDLTESIDEENVATMLRLSRKLGVKRLQEAAYEFFKNNFDDVVDEVLAEFDPGEGTSE